MTWPCGSRAGIQYADNPSSGAYGIPQALPFTKMPKAAWPASAGGSSNPRAQIGWMIDYIASVYGNPISADNHELNFHWYDKGGMLPPGLSLAYNGTGRGEPVGVNAQPVQVNLEFTGTGNAEFDSFMLKWMRQTVRVKGGGDVQQALGRPISGRG